MMDINQFNAMKILITVSLKKASYRALHRGWRSKN